MKIFWRHAKPFVLSAFCVVLALCFSPMSAPLSYALSTHNIMAPVAGLFNPGFAFTMIIMGIFIAFAAFCIALGALIEAYQQRELTPKFGYATLFCGTYGLVLLFYPGIGIAWPARRAGLQQAATDALPLIGAIEKFRLNNNRAPHNLEELVPIYLSEIQRTGMAAYPRFDYSIHNERAKFQTYQLQVKTFVGFVNWDTFNYWPEGDYPTEMYGGRVERIGDWAYVHE